jgi:hypothetical protein
MERIVRSVLVAVFFALVCSAASAADAAPDATEQMFWQSAERMATPESYRAYLTRYPKGFFAPLANAALGQADSPKAEPVAAVRPALDARAKSPAFSDAPESGAVSFNIGATFTGPMAHTVGWMGAKKQLVLPAGQWTALAAQDDFVMLPAFSSSSTVMTRVRLTTVSFGRFAAGRLVSLLQFTFSSQKLPPLAWAGVDGCERKDGVVLQNSRPSKSGWRDECAALVFEPKPLSDETAATLELKKSLVRLAATVSGPAVVSTLSFSEKQRGYLGVSRFDWPGAWLGDDAQTARNWRADSLDAGRQAFAARLWNWVQAYRPIAGDGYTNEFSDDGKVLADFSPAAAK